MYTHTHTHNVLYNILITKWLKIKIPILLSGHVFFVGSRGTVVNRIHAHAHGESFCASCRNGRCAGFRVLFINNIMRVWTVKSVFNGHFNAVFRAVQQRDGIYHHHYTAAAESVNDEEEEKKEERKRNEYKHT